MKRSLTETAIRRSVSLLTKKMMSSGRITLIVQIVGLSDIYGDKVFRQNSSEKKMYGE